VKKIRKTALVTFVLCAPLPLWGGTGRPSDGLLSFVFLLGFLLGILGILHLADVMKDKIRKILEDLFQGIDP
jgi:hypothetical protein